MKNSLKALLALSVSAAVFLCSCSGEAEIKLARRTSEIYFSWWGKDIRNDYTINAVKQFEAQNPEIDVIPEYSEWTGFQKRMYAQLSSHTEADVMQINYDWLYKYSPDGEGFYDLNELSEYIRLDNFSQEALMFGTVGGKLNGIPTALNAQTMFYNKTIYDSYELELPKTWNDLFRAAEVMSADGIYPLELNLKQMWLASVAYEEQKSGRSFIGENGGLNFSEENVADMLLFYKSLIDAKVSKPIEKYNRNDFKNGKTAGTMYWISDAEYYCVPAQKNGFEIAAGDYLTIDGTLSGWYAKPTSLYAIKRDTESPEAAAKLLDFLVNSEEMTSAQGLEKGIPLSRSALEVLEAKDMLNGIQFEANEKLAENSDRIGCIDPALENSELISAFKSAFDEMYYNNADISEVSPELYRSFTEIIRTNG